MGEAEFTDKHDVQWGTNGILPRSCAASLKRVLDSGGRGSLEAGCRLPCSSGTSCWTLVRPSADSGQCARRSWRAHRKRQSLCHGERRCITDRAEAAARSPTGEAESTDEHDVQWDTNGILPRPCADSFKRRLGATPLAQASQYVGPGAERASRTPTASI